MQGARRNWTLTNYMLANTINNKRIAKNTLLLYLRMLLMMAVSLYTSRIVLNALGIEDYGIYNVVGGVVTMFSFLNGTMAASTQRYLSYALGKQDDKLLQDTFSQTINLHILIALSIVLLGEGIGLWFVTHHLVIPAERMDAAIWAFHCSLFCFFFNVIQVPYNAMIIAQERMNVYAYFSIVEALLKLGVALIITYLCIDKLELYAGLLLGVSCFTLILYGGYCRLKYQTKLRLFWDKVLCRNLIGFSGWNLSAQIAYMARTQGINILLNMSFGPTLNAARGIAVQVSGAITSFVSNFQLAANPQIIKSYAQGDIGGMRNLIYNSSKFSFLLLSMLVIPFYLECEFILTLWLKTVPDYAVIFTKLVLISMLVDTMSGTLVYGALATGKIRNYQLILSLLFLFNPILVYVLFKSGFRPSTAYIVEIIFNAFALGARLYFLYKLVGISVRLYANKVIKTGLLVLLVSSLITYFIQQTMSESIFRILGVTITSILAITVLGYLIGLNKNEKQHVNLLIKNVYKKYGTHFYLFSRNQRKQDDNSF